jgi:hypothetical protein
MKNIFDYSHVKSVSCLVLIDIKSKEICGKIIANWSDNPAGTVCTAQIFLHEPEKYGFKSKTRKVDLAGEIADLPKLWIGKAGGYGYDKLSSAIASALWHNCESLPAKADFNGAGISAVQKYFENIGIDCRELL